VPNPLPRAALLWLAPLFVSCAVGAGVPDSEQMIGAAFTDGGFADLGGTAGTGGTGGGAFTGGGPIVPVLTGGLTGGGTGGPGGSPIAPPNGARLPSKLPMPSGTCPEFASGEVMVTPAGEAARRVILWSGQGSGGPLVIYWHSTGATPAEATVALSGAIEQITGAGGVVAAPYPGANEGMYPWVSTTPAALKVADEIVACAITKKGINPARIHTLGYSAGGLMSGSLAVQRSSYVGQTSTMRATFEDPTNKLSGLLFHGGPTDMAGTTTYPTAANSYVMTLRGNGGAAIVCNHNMGHMMPSDGPAAVLRFFEDHPFGKPSPYAAGLPPGFPAYCMLQP
jgi:hypothetical protein